MANNTIVTVTGEINAADLGPTLSHEHLYCDVSVHSSRPDNQVTDIDLVIAELAAFRLAGGRSIIEVTPEGIGRDAGKLRTISERSGVQIVSGIAF
jgi:phosphotriesterase-related protein